MWDELTLGFIYAAEAEQDGIVDGACALLVGQPMYRLYARQPAALALVAAALMGSAGHQSPKAVQALSQAFITFAMGFIRPPLLEHSQVHAAVCIPCRSTCGLPVDICKPP